MKKELSFLIVYSTFGDGHLQAANAIRHALAEQGAANIHMVDLLAEAHPWWNAVSRFAYLNSTANLPKLYGFSYEVTNRARPDPRLSRMFHRLGRKKMQTLIEELRPDAVIHTFPYLAVSEMNARPGTRRVPAFTVVTDYVLHSRWVHPAMDGYFAATEQMKEALIQAGIPEERIAVSGIPIREAFSRKFDRGVLCEKLGLDSGRDYALISAGAYGVQSQVRVVTEAVLNHSDFEVVLICGKNRKLHAKMDSLYRYEPRVRLLGYVNQMEEWMAASSCVVTKAGAITLTEAMALSVPAIVYRPLPGQEEGNARVLAERGAILTTKNLNELKACLRQVESKAQRRKMAAAMKEAILSDSAQRIALEVRRAAETVRFRPDRTAKPRKSGSSALRWRPS